MRSTAGEHYPALDHLRALAALMVFCWHFLHFTNGYPVPFGQAAAFLALFPLALLDEGHVGVSLFMTLSGYLFAKLLDGKNISYPRFLFNRALRLLPLLLFVVALELIFALFSAAPGAEVKNQLLALARGLVFPSLPHGGWSITVEWHFYLLLPLLLLLARKSLWNMALVLACAILTRYLWHREYGEVQNLAYFTIIGRIDQFVLGMLACHLPRRILRPTTGDVGVGVAALAFCIFYWMFDARGGFMRSPGYPSGNPLWIVMGSVEGVFFALFIAWYDRREPCAPQRNRNSRAGSGVSLFLARIGEYSYSIYLLHMFFVFHAARFIHERIMDISHFLVALPWALLCFLLMLPLARLSHHCIELPFMQWRKPYIIEREKPAGSPDRSMEKRP
ncbi:acyltransferase [Verminephrobacter eiseniae]|uniref:acyltransferase family protein n=1 Tax=Verminephrobacter eiseniae TaxID=364317 RepID=UPI002238AC89|nr:acyltransferase [Verminephrobacter eiseniae]MCW5261682.1 acyltransferase [Verminephrobacter eiseniae]